MKRFMNAYVVSLAAVAAAVVVRLLLDPIMGDHLPFATLYAAVIFSAWFCGRGPALLTILVGGFAAVFFLIEPRHSFAVSQVEYQIGLFMYGIVGIASVEMFQSMRNAQERLENQRRQLELEVDARRAAEKILAEEKERLRTTFASIGDAIIATDADGRVTNMNAVAETLTGWKLEGAAGQPLDVVFHIVNEETRQTVENPATRALKEGIIVGLANHTVLIARDGTERPIDDSAAPIRCKHGELVGCVLVFRDVTERRRQEKTLQESEERYRATVEHAAVGVCNCAPDGQYVYANRAYCEIVGYALDELLEKRWQEITSPEDRDSELTLIQRVRAGEIPSYTMEKRYVRKDGSLVWASLSASLRRDSDGLEPLGIGLIVDISDRKRAENTLRLQIIKTNRLVESNIIGVAFADNERITEANDAFLTLLGYTRGDVEAGLLNWREMTPPEYVAADHRALKELLERGACTPYQKESLRKDGSRVPILIGAAIIDPTAPTGVCFVQDMSRIKEVERQLREADRHKDEFLATLAHELRNPLAPIRNGLQLLRLTEDANTVEHTRAMMERQLAQMARLVDDLMDVNRISRGQLELKRERLPLAAVLSSALETSRPHIEPAGHELTVSLPDHSVVVNADLTRLAQAFVNLLNNAAKYSDRGGRIWLTAQRQGSDVVVSVKDTGIGIAAEHLPRIFDMFSQGDRSWEQSQGGLGIGLTLVKRLVEMHGGSIEAKSDGPGKGSEFIVRLPVEIEASVPPPLHEMPRCDGNASLRIMIVDDNRDAADSLSKLLKMMGNDTRTAYDGAEAVAATMEFHPDVILLDLGLPKLTGYEACRCIREQPGGDDVVVIAQTGWGQEEDRRRTHDAGFDHHLVKPVDPNMLINMLARLQHAKS